MTDVSLEDSTRVIKTEEISGPKLKCDFCKDREAVHRFTTGKQIGKLCCAKNWIGCPANRKGVNPLPKSVRLDYMCDCGAKQIINKAMNVLDVKCHRCGRVGTYYHVRPNTEIEFK